jgi:hypothetical protein
LWKSRDLELVCNELVTGHDLARFVSFPRGSVHAPERRLYRCGHGQATKQPGEAQKVRTGISWLLTALVWVPLQRAKQADRKRQARKAELI